MEKIIYLESDEEITSVIDRLKSSRSNSVALIVPRGASVVSGVVNLKLLRREADKLRKNVALVTTDKTAKKLASNVGFAVFDNLDEAIENMPGMEIESETEEVKVEGLEESDLKMPEIKLKKMSHTEPTKEPSYLPKSPKIELPRKGIWKALTRPVKFNWKYAVGTLAILIAAGAFTAFFLLPKATITLTLNSEDFDHQFRVKVDKSIRAYNPEENAIPGEVVTTTKLVSKKDKATGKKDIGEKATGTVTVYNEWSSEGQSFSAGTKFRASNGKVYTASSAFSVPGASIVGGSLVAGKTSIKAAAAENGEEYNGKVGTVTIPSLPSTQQAKIYGAGSTFSGGFTKTITVVSENDAKKAKEAAISEATQSLREEIKKEVSEGSEIAEEALVKDVIEEDISPAVDKEASDFEVKVKVKISTLAYQQKDLDQITEDNIKKVLEGRVLVADAEKEITKKIVKQDLSKGIMTMDISVVAQVGPEVDEEIFREEISGKNKDEINQYLTEFKQVKEAEINLWPFWVNKVPGLSDSVKIELKYVAKEQPSDVPKDSSQKEPQKEN